MAQRWLSPVAGSEEGEQAVAQLQEQNIEAAYISCDVTKKDQVEQLVAQIVGSVWFAGHFS